MLSIGVPDGFFPVVNCWFGLILFFKYFLRVCFAAPVFRRINSESFSLGEFVSLFRLGMNAVE